MIQLLRWVNKLIGWSARLAFNGWLVVTLLLLLLVGLGTPVPVEIKLLYGQAQLLPADSAVEVLVDGQPGGPCFAAARQERGQDTGRLLCLVGSDLVVVDRALGRAGWPRLNEHAVWLNKYLVVASQGGALVPFNPKDLADHALNPFPTGRAGFLLPPTSSAPGRQVDIRWPVEPVPAPPSPTALPPGPRHTT
ncbi:MAG: hypothetical protein OEV94_00945 [Deltaproteobacteria bacterium]|nr:hypothetical protein [Deltaproteobacteria bacterium]